MVVKACEAGNTGEFEDLAVGDVDGMRRALERPRVPAGVWSMRRPFQTMLRLTRSQKSLAAEKLADLANIAAAGLAFGQLIGGTSPGWRAF